MVCYKPGLLPLEVFPFNCVDLNIVKKSWVHCQVILEDVEHLSSFFWLFGFLFCQDTCPVNGVQKSVLSLNPGVQSCVGIQVCMMACSFGWLVYLDDGCFFAKCNACLECLQDKIFSHQKSSCSCVLRVQFAGKACQAILCHTLTCSSGMMSSMIRKVIQQPQHQKALDYWLWALWVPESLVSLSAALNKPHHQTVPWKSGSMILLSDAGVPNFGPFSSWHSRRCVPLSF